MSFLLKAEGFFGRLDQRSARLSSPAARLKALFTHDDFQMRANRLSAVRWGLAGRMIWAWIFTIPRSGIRRRHLVLDHRGGARLRPW